jgi:hypothetical protein
MGEWRYSSIILDLGSRWRRVVSFTPCRFTPGERAPGIHWIGGWVGPRAGLDAVENGRILYYTTGNRTRAVHLGARRYTD